MKINKISQAQVILNLGLAITGIPKSHREAAQQLIDTILEAEKNSNLKILHIGSGERTSPDKFAVSAFTLRGSYKGSYSLEPTAYPEISVGDEAYSIIVVFRNETKHKNGLFLFPVLELWKFFKQEFPELEEELEIQRRMINDDIVIMDLKGGLTQKGGAAQLRIAVRDAVKKGYRKVILNLAGINHVDSSGIGALVSVYSNLQNNQGVVKFLNPTERIKKMFAVTKLNTVFGIFYSEKEIINSF